MDQDRRDAAAWAQEWRIRRKNRRILYIIGGILIAALIAYVISFVTIHSERTTYSSADEMKAALQGRYAGEDDFEDIVIDGDQVILTYYVFSHYDREYAELFGYEYDAEDTVFTDRVVEWDHRHGVIKTEWMGNLIVDKNGNLRREDFRGWVFYKTDIPHAEPIDPETLINPYGEEGAVMTPEEEEAVEEREDSIETDEEAQEEAEATDENDVQP
ncbi:MAG: hypothetical protein E7230_01450 [Clostridiales bacterium]|nr:hypothetical protein [Clostridiales bacterium]